MAKQTINTGGTLDSPTAESINSAFTKVNAMTLELFTTFSVGGRLAIDLDASPDTIRDAFVKTNTNLSALYTDQSLPGLPVIDVGAAPDDVAAETIYAAFTKVNAGMTDLYNAAVPVPTADYYVATTGADSNPGTLASPFRTVVKGASVLTPGKTLFVRAGTYAEALSNNVPGGTSWAAPVRIAAYPGETVWLKPNAGALRVVAFSQSTRKYIEFDGINMDGTNVTYEIVKIEEWSGGQSHHIRIQNAELKGTATGTHGQVILATAQVASSFGGNEFINLVMHGHGVNDFDHGLYVQSSNNLIEGCDIYDFPGAGVHLYSSYGYAFTNNIVRNNIVRDGRLGASGQRGWGILSTANSQGTKIYNNLIYNVRNAGGGAGINLGLSNASGAEVYNNTIYGNAGYGIRIDSPYSGAIVKNNISYGNTGSNYTNSGSGTVASNNLFGTNPLFVNAGADNFHLQAGSPAIGAGVAIGMVTTDLDGVTRGTPPDIGVYEYVP